MNEVAGIAALDLHKNPFTETVLEEMDIEQLRQEYFRLLEHTKALEVRVRKSEERRRALMHILSDLNTVNRKLTDQRKAMIHILADYEKDRSKLAKQTERLDNSRRALMHILQDSHQSNLRLENSRKAMIHIMSDLKVTTEEVQRREQELREKQEQLVQAGKLATLGELTTGVAHELNNPLNNIGLFIGNVIDLIELGKGDPQRILRELHSAIQLEQVFINLLTNARDAMTEVTPKAITISCTPQVDMVEISVCDTGPGIPIEWQQKIFDPFFTTKEVGAGTGLGLSITYGIIKEHQGTITVENAPNIGALFRIQLPLNRSETESEKR